MQEKVTHIVFQVLNYLFSSQHKTKLLPVDKLILITLASHKGVKGIFPMQETLADEVGTSLRYMKTRLKYLEKNGFIFVEQINRKNHYHLTFLSTASDLQITSPKTTGDLQITSQVIYRSPHRGSTDATINKVSNKVRTERGRKGRAHPLSLPFEPNEESTEQAKRAGLTWEEANIALEKFVNHYCESGIEKTDWQLMLQNWLIREGDYKRKNGTKTKKDQVRSTVPDYEPPTVERRGDPEVMKNALKGILNQLGRGKPNGLGSEGEGETKKD